VQKQRARARRVFFKLANGLVVALDVARLKAPIFFLLTEKLLKVWKRHICRPQNQARNQNQLRHDNNATTKYKEESLSARILTVHRVLWKAADSTSKCHNIYRTLPPTIVV